MLAELMGVAWEAIWLPWEVIWGLLGDYSGALEVLWEVMWGLLDTVCVFSGCPGRALEGHMGARGSGVGALGDEWEVL